MLALLHWLEQHTLANPMVVHTVISGSRRTQHFWVRSIYLGTLIVFLTVNLLLLGALGGQTSLTTLAQAGQKLFAIISFTQVVLISIIAPVFLSASIAQSQAGQTFDILLTTPLTNLQIVLGSLLGRLFFVLTLLASGLPLFAVLIVFGGVPMSSVFVAFWVAGLVALVVGSMAVMLAITRVGGQKAVFMFIVCIATYLIAGYLLDVLILRGGSNTTWLTPLHPILVLESRLLGTYRPPLPTLYENASFFWRTYRCYPVLSFTAFSLVLSSSLLIYSAIFTRSMVDNNSSARWWTRWRQRLGKTPATHTPRSPRTPRPIKGNPIAWRQSHTRGHTLFYVLARWGYLLFGALLTCTGIVLYHLGVIKLFDFRRLLMVLLMVQLIVVALVGIFMSASAVSSEREDGTLDLILTTPMTPKLYIWGKLLGMVWFLFHLLLAPILTLGLVCLYSLAGNLFGWPGAMVTDPLATARTTLVTHPLMMPESPVLLALYFIPFVALCVMAGMSWSVRSKSVLGAVAGTVGIIGLLTLVMGFCGFSMAINVPWLGGIINSFSPTTSVMMLINPWVYLDSFASNPVGGRVELMLGAAFAAAGYSAVVYMLLTRMVKNFDHAVRKLNK